VTPAPDEHRAERWAVPVAVLVAAAMWEWASRHAVVSPLFFPPPSEIARALGQLVSEGTLGPHLRATLTRLAIGLVCGGIPGLAIGLMMGWSPRLRAAFDPLVAALHPLPKIAVLPLVMMIVGIGEASRVIVVAVAAFFPLLVNSMAGVRQIHPLYFEAAEAYGASRRRVLAHVVVPGSLPLVMTGVRLAFNVGMLIAISVELVSAREGLGKLLWVSWQSMRTEDVYAALVVIAVLGAGFNALLGWLTARLTPWNTGHTR